MLDYFHFFVERACPSDAANGSETKPSVITFSGPFFCFLLCLKYSQLKYARLSNLLANELAPGAASGMRRPSIEFAPCDWRLLRSFEMFRSGYQMLRSGSGFGRLGDVLLNRALLHDW